MNIRKFHLLRFGLGHVKILSEEITDALNALQKQPNDHPVTIQGFGVSGDEITILAETWEWDKDTHGKSPSSCGRVKNTGRRGNI